VDFTQSRPYLPMMKWCWPSNRDRWLNKLIIFWAVNCQSLIHRWP
jgi:hypothetical protein